MTLDSFDSVSLEILWNRLIGISEECWVTIGRTAFSMVIGEAQDYGCELLDARGESLAHSPRSMPVFNLTLPRAVKVLLEHFPPASLEEGDVLVTNDPWTCAGHLFDIAAVSPVFRRGSLVGLVGSIAHWSDIGGSRDPLSVREIYEEGVQIPPLKLYRRGEPNRDVIAMIYQNVRKPDMVIGDLLAQLAGNAVGTQRLVELMDQYRLADLSELASAIQGRAETAMRGAIRELPDGEYRHEVEFEAVDSVLTLPVCVSVHGDELTVDWAGAPPQVARGGVNCTYSYTAAHTAYALKCLLTPEIPSNSGDFRPFHVSAPEGSILSCTYPAAVNVRTMTGWYLAPAIFGALAPVLPDRVQAFTGMPMGVGVYGLERSGDAFNDHLFQGGGQGAGRCCDGKSALLFPTSAANTSVEMFENRTPILVECKELIPDSGGAGRCRGGLGQRVRIRKLYDDDRPALVSLHPQGIEVAPSGLFGGVAGRLARIELAGDAGPALDHRSLGGLAELRRPSQLLSVELAGGSGFGAPGERPLADLQADYEEGFVTAGGLGDYGCTVTSTGDHEAVSREHGVL